MIKSLNLLLIIFTFGCNVGPNIKGLNIDLSDKEKITVTTEGELPKLNGEWEGYCHSQFPSSTASKVTRLIFGQRCGESEMKLDSTTSQVSFEFSKDFFDYYSDREVPSCPKNSEDCSCYEEENSKECTQYSASAGKCTVAVSAEVLDTLLVERTSLLGDSKNKYLKLKNLKTELHYLDDKVKDVVVPKGVPFGFLSDLERAKSTCESFAKIWKNEDKPVYLVYQNKDDNKKLVFPGKASSPLSFNILDGALMAFKK